MREFSTLVMWLLGNQTPVVRLGGGKYVHPQSHPTDQIEKVFFNYKPAVDVYNPSSWKGKDGSELSKTLSERKLSFYNA